MSSDWGVKPGNVYNISVDFLGGCSSVPAAHYTQAQLKENSGIPRLVFFTKSH